MRLGASSRLLNFCLALSLLTVISSVGPTDAAAPVKSGSTCKKVNQHLVLGNFLFTCVKKGNKLLWNSASISKSTGETPNSSTTTGSLATPNILPASANPQLRCAGSGEISGNHPGWSSPAAINLTLVDLGSSDFGLYWCPAAAPSGLGEISYTVTSSLGGITCETTATSCEMSGVSRQGTFNVMATDETGSFPSGTFAIQNTGTYFACIPSVNFCNPGPGVLGYPTYGNVAPIGIGDCTFAAVANWEQVVLDRQPDNAQVQAEFSNAGGTDTLGLTNSQVFNYWQSHGIAGIYLNAALPFYTDPVHLKLAIDDPQIKAVIASLNFSKGQSFAGNVISDSSYHWVVVDGYTPQGPLVVTWGQTLQMTWQQWNLEAVTMWGISTRMAAPTTQ